MKDVYKNIIVIVLSVLFALVVSELFLAYYLPKIEGQRFDVTKNTAGSRVDEMLGHRLIPNEKLGQDKNGFRNSVVLDGYDIVALGDSFTYGRLDMPSWTEVLSELSGKTVYNMGVAGYGVAQYYYYLDKALEFKPKIVIVGLFIGNDIYNTYDVVYHNKGWEDYRNDDFVDDLPSEVANHSDYSKKLKTLRVYLYNNLKIYKLFAKKTRIIREKLGIAPPFYTGTRDWSNNDFGGTLLYDDIKELETKFKNKQRLRGVDMEDKNTREGLRLIKKMIVDMSNKAKKNNAELIVALFPTKQGVYNEIISDDKKNNFLFSEIVKNEKIIKKEIMNHCSKNNIAVIDVFSDTVRALKNGNRTHFANEDDHPNENGYRIYGESINNFLHNRIDQSTSSLDALISTSTENKIN